MTELITVAELAAALAALCRDHPELSDRHVFVPSEYGYICGYRRSAEKVGRKWT